MAKRSEISELRKLEQQSAEIARKMDEAKTKASQKIGDDFGKLLGLDGSFEVIEALRRKSSGGSPEEKTERILKALQPTKAEPPSVRESAPRDVAEPAQQAAS